MVLRIVSRRAVLTLPLLLCFTLLLACSGSSASESTPTSSPAAPAIELTPTTTLDALLPTATAPPQASQPNIELPSVPSGERILELVRALSVTIGPRPAGSDAELTAAEYISGLLESFGYDVELQRFAIGREVSRQSALSILTPESRFVASVPFANSASGTVQGDLVFAGLGRTQEFPPAATGAIVLIERGDLFFQEKVANAQAAGAKGVVVFNNELGLFFGSLQTVSAIPALSISQEEGRALVDALADGPVQLKLEVGTLSDAVSFNVIARPADARCKTITGGHYDSVVQAPGASDNASGTSAVIEIAAVLAGRGTQSGHCFVLFGAEELGLLGSRAFVESLTPVERDAIEIMLNFDMVGVGSNGWLLIGEAEDQAWGLGIAAATGIEAISGQLPVTTSSDHASFLAAGIPALMVHRTTDNLLHTPQDAIGRVDQSLLEEAARLGVALLESLSDGDSGG